MKYYHVIDDFEQIVSKKIIENFREALKTKNHINVCLSGGRTPLKILKKISSYNLDWKNINFFMTDERLVDTSSEFSNYYNLEKSLSLVQNLNLFRFYNNDNVDESLFDYEKKLSTLLTYFPKKSFDFLLLGFGNDGHIASIINENDIKESNLSKFVFKLNHTYGNFERISLAMSVLCKSSKTFLLSYGLEKYKLVRKAPKNDTRPLFYFLNNTNHVDWYYTKSDL